MRGEHLILTRLTPRSSPSVQGTPLWGLSVAYTRAGCCCCHKALDLLRSHQARWRFAIEEVDIDADPDLRAKYDTEVPVVSVNGKVRFRGVVNPALLERLLTAECRNAPRGA